MPPSPLFFFFILTTATNHLSAAADSCGGSCRLGAPNVRFPFALSAGAGAGSHNSSSSISSRGCGFPGFGLSCDGSGQTVIALRNSGDFIVQYIEYHSQVVYIRDPGDCLPRRYLDSFSLDGTPFVPEATGIFTFLNCSGTLTGTWSGSGSSPLPAVPGSRRVPCLSGETFTVRAMRTSTFRGLNLSADAPSCGVISTSVRIPVTWPRWSDADTRLIWSLPDCLPCEEDGKACGFKDDTGLEIGCSDPGGKSEGLSRRAKYGLVLGVGIPGLICTIGLGCFICTKLESRGGGGRFHSAAATAMGPQPTSVVLSGLDEPTIESYPKTLLGESRRLPKPSDNTCPICLSEYQPKETLRTIPECKHYYHAECIDEWLKMNATCPLCRNTPESSAASTPSLSLSSTSSSLLSTP